MALRPGDGIVTLPSGCWGEQEADTSRGGPGSLLVVLGASRPVSVFTASRLVVSPHSSTNSEVAPRIRRTFFGNLNDSRGLLQDFGESSRDGFLQVRMVKAHRLSGIARVCRNPEGS